MENAPYWISNSTADNPFCEFFNSKNSGSDCNFIGGGLGNAVTCSTGYSVIVGGSVNNIASSSNTVSSYHNSIGGGKGNCIAATTASTYYANFNVIAGG